MPQDSFRSVVYRSFVTCDDPKGVVECNKTIRKSNADPHKQLEHEERKDKHELQNMSSFQMMEVSRGAQKLNEVIDSWSNRPSFDNDSKYIAKDLLKGALDLQQSLVMLGKLQEASIAKSKKKHKNKPVEHKVDEFMDSYPFGDYDEAIGCQKPRLSLGGSSRDCYDELRDVIRESFARQNLLTKVSPNEKGVVDRNLCMDVGSSSSSQSSLLFSHSSGCSPMKVQCEKQKGPNLIAKLMGLEEVPLKPMSLISYKKMEKEKVLNQRRDLLDIDLPRPRRPRFVVQKMGRERRTLEEMIESMQFKGLIERKCLKDHCDGSLDVEEPPIVIMKPLHGQRLEVKELHNNDHVQMPSKMREEFPLNAIEGSSLRGSLKVTKMHEKSPVGRNPKLNLNKDKVGKNGGKSQVKLAKKNLDVQDSMSSTKIKATKREMNVKKIEKVPKIKATKSQESTKTEDTLKTSKTTRVSNGTKSTIMCKKITTHAKHITSASSIKSGIPKKKMKKDRPEAASVVNIPSDDSLIFDCGRDIQGSVMKTTTSEQITGEVMDASHTISDKSENATCSCSESSEPIIKEDVKYVEDGRNLDDTKSITDTKYILLSNASFLDRVDELFNIETRILTAYPTAREALDDCLTLECAREILERKSLHYTKTIIPLQQQSIFKKRKHYLSLQQLVEEISDGIDALRSYSKSCDDIVRVDSIYSMLERDLWWKEEVTGAWDSGWTNGFNVEEVNVVISDVVKLVLSEIFDDFVAEFYMLII